MTKPTALVTGANKGIGKEVARGLGRRGFTVLAAARDPERGARSAEELAAEGLDIRFIQLDVTDEQSIAEAVRQLDRLDVLINNAGIGIGSAVADMPTKKLDLQLDVNLRGVYLMARETIPLLKEAGAEHGKALMVNTASIAGKHGQGWLSAYSATKFGVVGLSQGLHKELSGDGIQVTALCPGFVATDMTDWVEGQVPKEEMIQPEDIAEAIRYLLRTSRNCIVPELQFIRPGDNEI
jgi:NAD(P)-dependent dehydrogenase (short-subunit alcohol dehydrogenase family)